MILKNRRTRETLEIEYSVFRKKFAKKVRVNRDSSERDKSRLLFIERR